MKPVFTESFEYEGGLFNVEIFDSNKFEDLKNVQQVYGFIFNEKNQMLVIRLEGKKNWCLPGGGPEDYDKNYEETLKREVIEEADVEIKEIKPSFYMTSKCLNKEKTNSKDGTLIRFVARVKKIKPQTIDPATGSINERKFIETKDFLEYCPWGEDGRIQLELALKTMNKR